MVDYSYDDLAADPSTLGYDLGKNLANGAANAICTMYANYPTGILPSIGSTPVSALATGMLDRLCRPRGVAPSSPPTPPFTGGQCKKAYNVAYSYTIYGETTSGSAVLNGPISGLSKRNTGSGIYAISIGCAPTPPFASGGYYDLVSNINKETADDVYPSVNISVSPVSGTDTCGDPFPEYPRELPPPEAYESDNRPITVNVGGTNVNIDFKIIPTVWAPEVNFKPELNVNVGGVNVNFGLGGISLSVGGGGSGAPPISLPGFDTRPIPPIPLPPTLPCPECDLTPVLDELQDIDDQLDDIQDCACEREYTIQNVGYGAARARQINLPPDPLTVSVNASFVSQRVKYQSGNLGGLDVYFIGWYAFGNASGFGDRKPLSYLNNTLNVPEGASAFTYSLVFQSTATLSVAYKDFID